MKKGRSTRPLKQKVSITLDVETIKAIRDISEEYEYSFSSYISLVLKKYLREKNKIHDALFEDI